MSNTLIAPACNSQLPCQLTGSFAIQLLGSITRLSAWLEANNYEAYDPFDGLSSRPLRFLTFNRKFPQQVLQQAVRRFPINVRPLLGIPRKRSTKGMGFLTRAFIRMHQATGDEIWADRARSATAWLLEHKSVGYSGACWGNHFDYRSRGFYLPKGVPTVVWTSLIAHAFLDAHEHFGDDQYLAVADSACRHIIQDLGNKIDGETVCIDYIPLVSTQVHNANTLAASLLARTYSFTGTAAYKILARKAIAYTAQHQNKDGSWYYAQKPDNRWIDSFHTAYVLDCFKCYAEGTGDNTFEAVLSRGYEYWKETFFLEDGTPKYYHNKAMPLDIQCSSQAIDTLVYFNDTDPHNLGLACKIAAWTIQHMQDPSGYFYYRRYSERIVNKTPTLHWGQATMFSALSGLYKIVYKSSCLL